MHTQGLSAWQHPHVFHRGNQAGERGTKIVLAMTAVMMVVEVACGWAYNSMALMADGFHMSSHVVAIGVSAFAYVAARRHASDERYAFGTWKIEVLGGFASAVFLVGIVGLMAYSSMRRLLAPVPIHYEEAIAIAMLGLGVNLASGLLLGGAEHGEHHRAAHDADRGRGHHDLNLRSAYVHVIADAATSVLAIAALAGGWRFGWFWLDPMMGLVGATVVALWAKRLLFETSKVLLDREMDDPVVQEIRDVIEQVGKASETRIADLHVWRVGRDKYCCALSLVTHDRRLTPQAVRAWLGVHSEIAHSTIEIHVCDGKAGC